jgi:hypothetical protein
MSVDIDWWREESWWERNSIPLGGFYLSPRQLMIILVFMSFGILASIPLPVIMNGIPFLGKLVVIGIFLFVGFLLSSFRVKMAPVEMLLLYRLRTNGTEEVARHHRERLPKDKESKSASTVETENKEEFLLSSPSTVDANIVHEMIVDDLSHPLPLNFSDKVKPPPDKLLKLRLLVDGMEQRDEDYVSPTKSHYRLRYVPALPRDIGTHDITIELEGQTRPVAVTKVTVRAKGVDLLDSKKVNM